MTNRIYILPSEAQELIFNSGLREYYFQSNFKKIKFRNKGNSVLYELDEVKDWVSEKYLENLMENNPIYTKILIEYKSLDDGQIWGI
jgi:hypothetical protein